MKRRDLLTAGAATLASSAISKTLSAARDYGPNAAPVRYPDPDIIALDPRFNKYKLGNTPILRIYSNPKHYGRKVLLGMGWDATCSSPTFPIMFNYVGSRTMDVPPSSEIPLATVTGTLSISREAIGLRARQPSRCAI